ncbi:sensor histidine kinase [Microbacterium sp. JZ37]|uniref:sensor histidine kinase n=1 Tax=Microbacterium sp. JZ37 TaxID=2654193 RepID=UPI002B494E48|nr:histidine kinase [Microbacterium sp. JZ37]WRH18267.1 two-component sensor histidine kinase [Microbacterium sp. JZ37]
MTASDADRRGPLVAAVLLCAIALPMTIAMLVQLVAPVQGGAWATWIGALAVVLHAAAFASPWLPRAAFAVGAAVMLALALMADAGTSSAALVPSAVAFLLLEWQVASTQGRATAVAALVVGIVGAFVITSVDVVSTRQADPALIAFEVIALAAVASAAWVLGRSARRRRIATAERERQQVRDALAAERARIGRDLHDVVSHSLTVMIAQAEAARVLTSEPRAADALARVADTGRSAMQGLRGMLRVLDEADAARSALDETAPAPDLASLAALVAGAGSSDHRLSFVETGHPRPLAPDAQLALYRAAQEAITNAVRHVRPPVEVRVELAWGEQDVRLTVADDGGSGPRDDPGGGTGLIGMAERVRQAGGALEVRRGAGWTVQVTMPVEQGA